VSGEPDREKLAVEVARRHARVGPSVPVLSDLLDDGFTHLLVVALQEVATQKDPTVVCPPDNGRRRGRAVVWPVPVDDVHRHVVPHIERAERLVDEGP
jgi:hypothetical protein